MKLWFCKYSMGFISPKFYIIPFEICCSKFIKAKFKFQIDWLNKYTFIGFWCETEDEHWMISKNLFYLQLNPLIISILFINLIDKKK